MPTRLTHSVGAPSSRLRFGANHSVARLLLIGALVAVAGCKLSNREETDAVIQDGQSPAGFGIATVNGSKPLRHTHRLRTVEPSVLVSPGIHTFAIEGSKETFVAKVEPGKTYQTVFQNSIPALEEVPADDTKHFAANDPTQDEPTRK